MLLVINAGSSSIKFSVFEVDEQTPTLARRFRGEVDGLGARPHSSRMMRPAPVSRTRQWGRLPAMTTR